jgi:hypothetical protein
MSLVSDFLSFLLELAPRLEVDAFGSVEGGLGEYCTAGER